MKNSRKKSGSNARCCSNEKERGSMLTKIKTQISSIPNPMYQPFVKRLQFVSCDLEG